MNTFVENRATETREVEVDRIEDATFKLLAHCRSEDWSGYDPYDALNSELFAAVPVLDAKWPRLVFTQVLKRSPINFRPLLQVPKLQNPKALALSLQALVRLRRIGRLDDRCLLDDLVSRLARARSAGPYWSWGYSFPWQGRSILVQKDEPNLVCTTFVAEALLDLFEETSDSRYLAMVESAGDYFVNELFWVDAEAVASFGYPNALAKSRVHNANLLAAAFLLRLHRHTGSDKARKVALRVATYSAGCQRPDGSWPYGELRNQNWIDNFHTGYNLCALRRIAHYGGTNEFESNIAKGYQFYRDHFLREDGAPRYFHNRTYPIDVHCVAQSVLTLLEFANEDAGAAGRAHQVLTWALDNLWDAQGYFYYQKTTWGTNTISYMRWAQAWMLLALATFLERQAVESNHAA